MSSQTAIPQRVYGGSALKGCSEEIEPREDTEAYCPRIDKQVLVISGCCFHRERALSCWGCVFNRDFVTVKLTILLKELLESRGRQNG